MNVGTGLEVELAGINLKNPVMAASGTFGYGREYSEYIDLGYLGAVVVKGTSSVPWDGNPMPRIVETPSGMLNAIGLQNPGVDHFIGEDLPFLRRYDVPVIVNIVGRTAEEYREVASRLNGVRGVAGLELNISCPNVKEGGMAFGTSPRTTEAVVQVVRRAAALPLIVKLSPNVTDITEIARAAESAGADALSLINTLRAMVIDVEKRRPVLGNVMGGLSGPALRPVAVRMVWEVYRAVKIPLVGMGGITTARDALEFIMAGATAVAVGTANFVNPCAALDVIEGLRQFVVQEGVALRDLVGAAHLHS